MILKVSRPVFAYYSGTSHKEMITLADVYEAKIIDKHTIKVSDCINICTEKVFVTIYTENTLSNNKRIPDKKILTEVSEWSEDDIKIIINSSKGYEGWKIEA